MHIPPRLTVDSERNVLRIETEGDDNNIKSVDVTTQKLVPMNLFFKLGYHFIGKFTTKRFVQLESADGPILIKISEIEKKLGISKKVLVIAESEGKIKELLLLAYKAKDYNMSKELLSLYFFHEGFDKGVEGLEDFIELDKLATKNDLPLSTLIKAKEKGIPPKVFIAEMKLDALYNKQKKSFVSKFNTKITYQMTKEDLKTIKEVMRIAHRVLMEKPKGGATVEEVIPITETHRILVQSSENSFKITGLFGTLLGEGGGGAAVHAIDLLEGSLVQDEESVLKMSNTESEEGPGILREADLLKKLNPKGNVLGLQKPVRMFTDVFSGKAGHIHLGPKYQTDLYGVISNNKLRLSLKQKVNMAYELMSALQYIHRKNVTHGDIKPTNVFCNLKDRDEEVHVFLADLGGAIDHTNLEGGSSPMTSPYFRVQQDHNSSTWFLQKKDFDSFKDIEKAADVFAMCSTLCLLFIKNLPYNGIPYDGDFTLDPNLESKLKEGGLSPVVIKLLIRGLSKDWTHRPTAGKIKSELNNMKAIL